MRDLGVEEIKMSEKEVVHVVMLSWLAFGHLIPFLELSIALAKFGIRISFLSTPRNIQKLPKIPPNLSNFIQFVPLPLPNPASDPLPENAESTNDVAADKMDSLRLATDLLQPQIKNFIANNLPNWIIVDFFPHWAADIAQEFNIPLIKYSPTSAATAAFFWLPEFLDGGAPSRDLTAPPEWVDFPSRVFYKEHETAAMHDVFYRANSSGIADGGRLMKLNQASHAIAVRSCPELEAEYLKALSTVSGKPVLPVGFLPRNKIPPSPESPCYTTQEPWSRIFRWLDEQNSGSVLFVGFGSEANISQEQVHEIAYGLELSKLPFVWVLRNPKEGEGGDDGGGVLPPGFCTRTAEQGVVQVGWAPQLEILGHRSVGGLFVHAGWSSIIEAMQFGHVLVLLPLAADQPLNARLMAEEKDLAVEVARDEGGWFTRDGVAEALKKVMLSAELRARAERASIKVFGNDDLHSKYVEEFAGYLKTAEISK